MFFGAAATITNRTAPRIVVFTFFQSLKKIAGRTIFFMLTERKNADRKKRIMKRFGKVKEWIGTCFLNHDLWMKRCQNTGVNKCLPMF